MPFLKKFYVDTLSDIKVMATQTLDNLYRFILWQHVGGQLSATF